MKKKKQKEIRKEARKLAKVELTTKIISALEPIAVNFVENKKVAKLIKKNAGQLSKKLSKMASKPVDPSLTTTALNNQSAKEVHTKA